MTTPLSGTIALSDFNVEWGLPSNTQISLADVSSRTICGRPLVGSTIQISEGYGIDIFTVGVGVNPSGFLGYSQAMSEVYGSLSPLFYYGHQLMWVACDAGIGTNSYLVLVTGSWAVPPVPPAPSRISTMVTSANWYTQGGAEARYGGAIFLASQSGQFIKVAMKRAF